jgi:hypothetical protein
MNRTALKHHWDRVLALVIALVGTVMLVVGWVHVSGTSVVAAQIPYLASECVGGLIAFGIATTLWISADLRDEWAKLDQIHRAFVGPAETDETPHSPSASTSTTTEGSQQTAATKGRHGAALEASLRR